MREKWVFFDLDGTLTQSEEGIWNCARYAAEKMGFPQPAEETLKKWIGPPLIWSFQHLMGMTEAQAWQAQEYYRERYTTVGKYENLVYPGVRRMLRALKRGGVRMGIVTGKPEQPTRDILAYFGILRYFERIACATDAKAEKEHLIRSVMPEEPAEVWMVGDRRFDMEGGAAAGGAYARRRLGLWQRRGAADGGGGADRLFRVGGGKDPVSGRGNAERCFPEHGGAGRIGQEHTDGKADGDAGTVRL